MRIVDPLPEPVIEIENDWVPMPDGCRLAARLWLPRGAEAAPVPAILEYLPYRKRDRTRERDEPMHLYFAGHGYAAVRVDVRGTGESDGVLEDEYSERELADGEAVIAWLAEQPWCDGRVGMMGKSWGGFNALQLAARRPPALGAVIAVCASDDRYTDDAHYMGGCLLNENLVWGSSLLTLAAQPPDPMLVGERWREMWHQRLDALPLYPATWLAHPTRDAYWRRGSVGDDLGRIGCPVFAVGGWADAYTDAVPRLIAGLRAPCRGWIGPWAHLYPHNGVPGPAAGFLQEALGWWDRWLKGIDRGVDGEPRLLAWMQESAPPEGFFPHRPGRWVGERQWPSPRIGRRWWRADAGGGLTAAGGAAGGGEEGGGGGLALLHRSPASVGLAAGAWCAFGIDGELPGDQRPDDERSLVFDSPPLGERLEILGAPEAVLRLAVDRPAAQLAVRLNEVAPDGTVSRVCYGVLDLGHREGHERPLPVAPGEPMEVRMTLGQVAHSFAPGWRLRLAVSTAYWPVVWPAPEAVTLTLDAARLALPVRPPDPADAGLRPPPPPETALPPDTVDLDPGGASRVVERDPVSGETVLRLALDAGAGEPVGGAPAMTRIESIGLDLGHAVWERFAIRDAEPSSAELEVVQATETRRGDWRVRVVTRCRQTADLSDFRLEAELEAWEGERRVAVRRWERRVPRAPQAPKAPKAPQGGGRGGEPPLG